MSRCKRTASTQSTRTPFKASAASLRHAEFVRHFLSDPGRNATQAAIKAGYAAASANRTAYKLLRQPEIAAAIKAVETAALKAAGVTLERIIAEQAAIAFASLGTFLKINEHGDPVFDLSDCTPESLSQLAFVSFDEFTEGRGNAARQVRRIRIKMHDKLQALSALAKHFTPIDHGKVEEDTDALTELLRSLQGTAFPVASSDE